MHFYGKIKCISIGPGIPSAMFQRLAASTSNAEPLNYRKYQMIGIDGLVLAAVVIAQSCTSLDVAIISP